MIRLFVVILCLTSTAWAHDLDGSWSGSGLWQQGDRVTPTNIQSELQTSLEKDGFHLKECWKFINDYQRPAQRCISSIYQVVGEDIYQDGEKIGDIYPFEIDIFTGNSQVSEQLVLKMNGKDQMQYHYSSANMDGGADFRAVQLTRVSKP